MNLITATTITAALLAKAKVDEGLGIEGVTDKLNRPNFIQRAMAVGISLDNFGVTLEAVMSFKRLGWFRVNSPEQLVDWLTAIIDDLKANGAAGCPAECFVALNDLGATEAEAEAEAEADDLDSWESEN